MVLLTKRIFKFLSIKLLIFFFFLQLRNYEESANNN